MAATWPEYSANKLQVSITSSEWVRLVIICASVSSGFPHLMRQYPLSFTAVKCLVSISFSIPFKNGLIVIGINQFYSVGFGQFPVPRSVYLTRMIKPASLFSSRGVAIWRSYFQ